MTEETRTLVRYRLGRAREALEEAVLLLERGYTNTCVNRLYYGLLTAFSKKWTYELPRHRASSGRHLFEAHTNRFALTLQVHRAKPFCDLRQQALRRNR